MHIGEKFHVPAPLVAKTKTSSGLLNPKAFLLATLTLYLENTRFKIISRKSESVKDEIQRFPPESESEKDDKIQRFPPGGRLQVLHCETSVEHSRLPFPFPRPLLVLVLVVLVLGVDLIHNPSLVLPRLGRNTLKVLILSRI